MENFNSEFDKEHRAQIIVTAAEQALKRKKYSEGLKLSPLVHKIKAEEYYGYIQKSYPGLVIDELNREIIEMLCLYFTNDKRFEDWEGNILTKGIALGGGLGVGKTYLMNIFAINPRQSYRVKSCQEITLEFRENDYQTFEKYTKTQFDHKANLFTGSNIITYCFDDLGTENVQKVYGNQDNVMSSILSKCYDNMLGQIHITTNLCANQIEESYGERIRSRFRQMFNFIEFTDSSIDRRK
ncbi:hypothetical protein SAMN04515674_105275 [Pseudarcicella hirudinis]|uniref:DNA replication protein DnaC n=1 Tax=Pseudarcicella hirudinis TaxID=1079859 RepID=A0A1I5SYP6_9BACT|nr:hypothetical protein [Pseudarcicella hirudinis]SFP75751.1 hypothetical protein SAMN04515674_105275 [Pseudarcicella hirudinis]